MRITEQGELKKLLMDCKSELLNHTLQSDIVSPHIKQINSNIDSCLAILQKNWTMIGSRAVGSRSPRLAGDSREKILFFAYCMSKYDAEFVNSMLGRKFNQTEAFEYLANVLHVKVATLRNYRDTFDSHVKQLRSNRQGWKKSLSDEFKSVLAKYEGKSEEELIIFGKEVLSENSKKEVNR